MKKEHDPSDNNCVQNVSGNKNGTCWICLKYDNATWLTHREIFESRQMR